MCFRVERGDNRDIQRDQQNFGGKAGNGNMVAWPAIDISSCTCTGAIKTYGSSELLSGCHSGRPPWREGRSCVFQGLQAGERFKVLQRTHSFRRKTEDIAVACVRHETAERWWTWPHSSVYSECTILLGCRKNCQSSNIQQRPKMDNSLSAWEWFAWPENKLESSQCIQFPPLQPSP